MTAGYPIHSGQYKRLSAAEEWAAKLTALGDIVEIRPIQLWEVIITGRMRK